MRQAPILQSEFANRYVLEQELGRGATAVVYLARDRVEGRKVAIKVLRHELTGTISTERFFHEIQMTAGLSHPHIVPVLTSGEQDGVPYCVLPYMDGGTLRQRLVREKQLPISDVISIGAQMARALGFAHSRNLIHRDVKPENILFTAGEPTLADFGIARALERSSTESTTSTGIVRGTPAYMSPEQAGGDRTLDGRSDIYSLACVLYEATAGVAAFVGPTPQAIVAQRLLHMPRPVRVYRPAVPVQLEAALERALAQSPADRFRTAAEFADALESVDLTQTSARNSSERPSFPTAEVGRFFAARRRSLIYATVALIAVVLAAAALIPKHPAPAIDIPDGDPRRIAVLYFVDQTPASVPSYIADGITEDLIDQLSTVRALRVTSPDAVRRFRGGATPSDSMARLLGVGTIVAGTVAQSGSTMRITVRLADAATGQQLTSRTLEAKRAEMFALRDRLTDSVAVFLRQRIGDVVAIREHRAATKSNAAWDLAQQASDATRQAVTLGRSRNDSQSALLMLQADSLYQRAATFDPSWTLPPIKRGKLAIALAPQSPIPPTGENSRAYQAAPPNERRMPWLRRAVDLANTALALDSRSAEALELRGQAQYSLAVARAPGMDSLMIFAERDLRAALDLRPDFAGAWATLAELSSRKQRYDDAAIQAEKAYDADAFFEVRRVVSVAFFATLQSGRFAEASHWCQLGRGRYADDPRFAECELTLLGWTGTSHADVKRASQVLAQIERRDTLHMLQATWEYRRFMLAAVSARAGMRDSAMSLLASTHSHNVSGPGDPPSIEESYVLLLLGNRDSALALLRERARAAPQLAAQVAHHRWFISLHGDPSFEQLTKQAH